VYFIKAESIVTGSCIEDVVKSTDQLTPSRYRGPFESRWPDPSRSIETVRELCYFRCYELPAGTVLPDGLAYVVDNVSVEGHVTVYAKQPVKGELVEDDEDTYIKVGAMAKLPWKFVGYYLCPAAERKPKTPSDADGRRLLSLLCRDQSFYALEPFESLKMLVTVPDYSLRKLVTSLSPAEMAELDAAMAVTSDQGDISFLQKVGLLIEEVAKVRSMLRFNAICPDWLACRDFQA
jgi:hypothetical protein